MHASSNGDQPLDVLPFWQGGGKSGSSPALSRNCDEKHCFSQSECPLVALYPPVCEVQMMFSLSFIRDRKQAQVASLPVSLQMGILCSLAGLVLWTVYFSPYPAVHNTLHHTRHTTLGVACH